MVNPVPIKTTCWLGTTDAKDVVKLGVAKGEGAAPAIETVKKNAMTHNVITETNTNLYFGRRSVSLGDSVLR